MDNNKKKNLLIGIGTIFVFIFFGYFSYQDATNRRILEESLEYNASPPQRDFAERENISFKKSRRYEYSNSSSNNENEIDVFNEHLDEYLSDPEDEISYLPEIYDALIDDDEKKLIENEIDY